jgi:two-component system sensor histidine kinase UhpB
MDPILILQVDDDLVDRTACRRRLAGAGAPVFSVLDAEDGESGLRLARGARPHCILLDHHLPDLNGLDFLARLGADPDESLRQVPVLMLTGADSAAVATEALRRGAGDYLVKDGEGRYLDLLPAAVERLVRERRTLAEKRRAEAKFRTLVEQIQAISYVVAAGREHLEYISPQIRMLGYSAQEWLADPGLHAACMLPDERAAVLRQIAHARRHGTPLRCEYRLRARDGTLLWFRDQADLVRDEDGGAMFVQGTLVDITINKLAEQSLSESHEALRRLAAYQERIRESERQRIARELHDELGGVLTGISAYLSVLRERHRQAGEAPDPLLGEAGLLAHSAIDTMRRVITDLRPSVLDQLGIWAALEWQLDRLGKRSCLQCSCAIEPAAAVNLDAERSIVLFRIVQEALTNVQRHAQAARVALQVRRDHAGLVLTVEDDGRGMPAHGPDAGSCGILGMQERSRSVGGELAVLPRAGGGTVVRLRLPLEEPGHG